MKFNSTLGESIFKSKYMLENVDISLDDPLKRIDAVITKHYPHLEGKAIEYGTKRWVGFAGGLYRSAMNPKKNVSAVNCTTLYSPKDNLESIAEGWYWWAKFAATGQGEGVDLSNLRPNKAKVHNSSNTSTGPISFMRTFDAILKEIAQEGRRGASLISLNISHPDILDFIKVKDEEGILETANISIKVTDKFMKAVENDKEWEFKYKNEYETITKKMSAKKLFRLIAEHAHKSGDPGLLFWDTSVKYSNSDVLGYPIENVNACSEQVLDGHNICLLSSINLALFHEYEFDIYLELIEFMTFALDAFRLEELAEGRSPSEEQMKKMINMPRIGLGVTGLADYYIRKNIAYDSIEAVKEAIVLFGSLSGEAYKASYSIAKNYHKKSFPKYNKKDYKKSPFIKMLLKEKLIEDFHLDYQAHVCKTTIAPNGSLTYMVEAGGSGIEPIFGKYYVRRERATMGDWKEWFTFSDLVTQELENKGLEVTKENADKLDPEIWKTAHTIDNKAKLTLIGTIQKYIDSAVSVTYNLKEDATVEEIEEIYMTAWKNESKGVTVYREGSKVGVMVTEDNYEASKDDRPQESIRRREDGSIIRPKKVPCDIHEIKIKGENYLALVGILENKPYEIFVTKNIEKKEYPMHNKKKGIIHKPKKGIYNLVIENGEDSIYIEDITNTFDPLYLTLGRLVSLALRSEKPLQILVEQLLKDKNFAGFEKTVGRVLKKYITEGERVKTSTSCDECGSTQLMYQEGCITCNQCGWSKCS